MARIPAKAPAMKSRAGKGRGTPIKSRPSPVRAQAEEEALEDSTPEDLDELPGPSTAPEAQVDAELKTPPKSKAGKARLEDEEEDDLSDLDALDGEIPDAEEDGEVPGAKAEGPISPDDDFVHDGDQPEAPRGDLSPPEEAPAEAPAKKRGKAKPAAQGMPFQAPSKVAKAGTVSVTRHYASGDSSAEEQLDVRQFVTFPASVSVNYGMTLNLGDYQSAKVSVQVTLPCYAEELEEAYKAAAVFAESKLQSEVDAIRSASGAAPAVAEGSGVEDDSLAESADTEAGDPEPFDDGVEADDAPLEEVE